MKRTATLLLAVCLLLCACGPAREVPEITTTETTMETTETTVETTMETTEATEPPILYRHPLTGEPLEEPFKGRPVAVSIGNTKAALPQYGISGADFFFEVEAEGGITRFLPIFTDLDAVDAIGPIRSARTFFNNLAAGWNAPIAHCGGSDRGIKGYYDLTGSKISGWNHIDQFTYGKKYFYRDLDRNKNQGYAWEHCLFTTGKNMQTALNDLKYNTGEILDYGLLFDENVSLEGEAANQITVSFLGKKTSEFTYDGATGLYSIRQYDRDLIDGATGKQLTFKNIFVLYAKQEKQKDSNYVRSYYDLIGSGDGYFAVNGKIVKIKWSREDVKKPFVYTLEDGTPITLGVGKSYIGVSSTKSKPVSYQ